MLESTIVFVAFFASIGFAMLAGTYVTKQKNDLLSFILFSSISLGAGGICLSVSYEITHKAILGVPLSIEDLAPNQIYTRKCLPRSLYLLEDQTGLGKYIVLETEPPFNPFRVSKDGQYFVQYATDRSNETVNMKTEAD